jgi:hypothetical protein
MTAMSGEMLRTWEPALVSPDVSSTTRITLDGSVYRTTLATVSSKSSPGPAGMITAMRTGRRVIAATA